MSEKKRGIIRAVKAEGGVLSITFEDPKTKKQTTVHGDNGPTVRALRDLLGPEITSGYSLLVDKVVGNEVGYALTTYGWLAYLTE